MAEAAVSRIRIKLGHVEVEFEGTEEFVKRDLKPLVTEIIELYKGTALEKEPLNDGNGNGTGNAHHASGGQIVGTTNTLAAKLGVKTGPDLIVAAAAQLTFVGKVDSFPRQKLLESMKTAKNYYKRSHVSNMSSHLKGLLAEQKLIEPSSGTFALTAGARRELEKKLLG